MSHNIDTFILEALTIKRSSVNGSPCNEEMRLAIVNIVSLGRVCAEQLTYLVTSFLLRAGFQIV